MSSFRKWWKTTPAAIRKPLVFMVGFAVVVAGLAMLVLPGPGWPAVFLGFAILATEFVFAEKVRDWLIGQLRRLIAYGKKQWAAFYRKIKQK